MSEALPPDPYGHRRHLIITIDRVLDATTGEETWPVFYDAHGISPYEALSLLQKALDDFAEALEDDDVEVDDD